MVPFMIIEITDIWVMRSQVLDPEEEVSRATDFIQDIMGDSDYFDFGNSVPVVSNILTEVLDEAYMHRKDFLEYISILPVL